MKKTKRLDNNKNGFFTYSVLEKEGAAIVVGKSCELVLRGGERAKWRLLIVYEHAMLRARNKVGRGLASLVQTYHAAVRPHKFILVCFEKFCYKRDIFHIDNDKG